MATGAQRQHFAVLGSLGISMGYTSIITHSTSGGQSNGNPNGDLGHETTVPGHSVEPTRKQKQRTPGILHQLSQACRKSARDVAATSLFVTVYDNINMMIRVAEQVLGSKS